MRKIISTALAFIAGVLCSVAYAEVEEDNGVLVLKDDNFDEELAKHEFLLVEFYAPWCGHCKKLAPEYEKAAATLAAKDPPRKLAKVDATANDSLAKRFGIQGFPTLFWFVNGEKFEYNGGRTADTIVSWITKKTGNPADAVTCDELADKASSQLNLVYFGEESGDKFDLFMGAAKNPAAEKFAFFKTGAECAEKYGATAPGMVLVRTFDEPNLVFTGDDGLLTWMNENSTPTLFEFGEDYIEPIFQQKKSCIFLFSEDKNEAYQTAFAEASKSMKGKILFSTSGVSSGIQERLGEFIGVTKDMMPTMRIVSPETDLKKYKWEGDLSKLTVADVEQYVNDFKDGKLTPFRKSETEPESNDGPVKVVVGTSWEKIVGDTSKDVLMEYYAPWCGHCKALAPKYDQLGEHVKDIDDLVIAKMDATANEVEGVEIRGFPTLKWYPKDNKKGEDYSEGRELEDFKKFLAKKSASYAAKFPAAEEKKEEEPEKVPTDDGAKTEDL